MSDAPATGNEAAQFLRHQHAIGSLAWRAKCLMLQREARKIPALYPSALSAALATPKSERITHISGLRRGMVAFSDDPNDSNPFGHVYFIAGRRGGDKSDPNNVLVWSNDVVPGRPGAVGLVTLHFFKVNWGDNFQFGATWLNGYQFHEFDKPPKPAPERVHLADNYDHAIDDISRELHRIKGSGHPNMVAALENDLARMKRNRRKFD